LIHSVPFLELCFEYICFSILTERQPRFSDLLNPVPELPILILEPLDQLQVLSGLPLRISQLIPQLIHFYLQTLQQPRELLAYALEVLLALSEVAVVLFE
jgi:hypothetical protein